MSWKERIWDDIICGTFREIIIPFIGLLVVVFPVWLGLEIIKVLLFN